MRKILTACLCLLWLTGFSQDNQIVIGIIDSIPSKILNEQRKIWVSVPSQSSGNIYGKKNYPVLYLLDGDAHFQSVTGLIQQLSTVGGNTVVPEMIVVGIPNTDRTRDLTPTHIISGPDGKTMDFLKTSGGGEKFLEFIEKELMPHIDSLYPVEPYKILVGHSFGGLTVMNTILNHSNLFNAYVAIDPSMWWDNQTLLKQADKKLHDPSYVTKPLFLAIANTMDEGMDVQRVTSDTSSNTMHIRSNLAFAKMIDNSNTKAWTWKYYNDDSHGSVPLIAEYDALHTLFKGYSLKLPNDPKAATFTSSTVNEHYRQVSAMFGYTVKPPEVLVNAIGYNMLQSNEIAKAHDFFALNIENYPQSFNVYDSMGDYYVGVKDNKNAIRYFEKAIAIKEYPETRKKLNDLKAGK